MSELPTHISRRLRLPVIMAPMLRVSGVEMVKAACKAGVIGAFPTVNPRTHDELDDWLTELDEALNEDDAPYCPNLIMRRENIERDVEVLLRHKTEIVITSVGSPERIMPALREAGITVLADVATVHHARKALEAGVDGLILLSAGAGGNTGWLNPFAFVRAVKKFHDGPLALAGGMSDGSALFAAETLGCGFGYMGTKFIATTESRAEERYKNMVVESSMDDVMRTRAFTGMDTSMLVPSIVAAGLDPTQLHEDADAAAARKSYGSGDSASGPKRWRDIWSAGHTVSGVDELMSVADVVEQTLNEYREARSAVLAREQLAAAPTDA